MALSCVATVQRCVAIIHIQSLNTEFAHTYVRTYVHVQDRNRYTDTLNAPLETAPHGAITYTRTTNPATNAEAHNFFVKRHTKTLIAAIRPDHSLST